MELKSELLPVVSDNNIKSEISDKEKKDETSMFVTYLCPLSGCVFTCSTISDRIYSQHLEISHFGSNLDNVRFINLG